MNKRVGLLRFQEYSSDGYSPAQQPMSHNSLLKLECILLALLSSLIAHENSDLVFDTLITQQHLHLGLQEEQRQDVTDRTIKKTWRWGEF